MTPESSDSELTPYLWGRVREMMKTAIENGQNLIIEGCYIPFDWKEDFGEEYREHIRFRPQPRFLNRTRVRYSGHRG